MTENPEAPNRLAQKSSSEVGHRRVLKIAIPIILANVTVPLLGVVDTGVVGQLGQAAPIAAVGIGSILLTAIYWMFGFLRMGTTGFVAQAYGRDDRDEVCALLVRGLLFGALAGSVLLLTHPLWLGLILQLAPTSPEVSTLAGDYLSIRIFSAPAFIALYAMTGWLIALEKTRSLLLLQLWMNGLNALLDVWFVLGLNWGVPGVAWATCIAEWSGFVWGLWLCRDGLLQHRWHRWRTLLDRSILGKMLKFNGDLLIRSLILEGMLVCFLLLGGHFGDDVLAANQVLLQFLHLAAYGMDGVAFATETLVGQAIGQRNQKLLRTSVGYGGFWGLIICALGALFFALAGPWIIDLISTAPSVRTEARTYLWYAVATPIVGVVPWMLDGVFIGATRGRDMRNSMFIALAVYAIALWILLPHYENHGLWLAILLSFAVRGLTLALKYPSLERDATP